MCAFRSITGLQYVKIGTCTMLLEVFEKKILLPYFKTPSLLKRILSRQSLSSLRYLEYGSFRTVLGQIRRKRISAAICRDISTFICQTAPSKYRAQIDILWSHTRQLSSPEGTSKRVRQLSTSAVFRSS